MKRDKLYEHDGNLNGFKPYELANSHTDTVIDNTQGIKYIVRRWQETGVVPSQIVRHPLPASDKVYPWEKKGLDLSDIPTKHESRFTKKMRDAQRDLNAMRDAQLKKVNKVDSEKVDTQTIKEQTNQDTNKSKSDE